MISVGIGMNVGYRQQIEEMGSLYVINVNAPYSGDKQTKDKVQIDTASLEKFRKIEGVEAVTPVFAGILYINRRQKCL